jgi:hypothetical protein
MSVTMLVVTSNGRLDLEEAMVLDGNSKYSIAHGPAQRQTIHL